MEVRARGRSWETQLQRRQEGTTTRTKDRPPKVRTLGAQATRSFDLVAAESPPGKAHDPYLACIRSCVRNQAGTQWLFRVTGAPAFLGFLVLQLFRVTCAPALWDELGV